MSSEDFFDALKQVAGDLADADEAKKPDIAAEFKLDGLLPKNPPRRPGKGSGLVL